MCRYGAKAEDFLQVSLEAPGIPREDVAKGPLARWGAGLVVKLQLQGSAGYEHPKPPTRPRSLDCRPPDSIPTRSPQPTSRVFGSTQQTGSFPLGLPLPYLTRFSPLPRKRQPSSNFLRNMIHRHFIHPRYQPKTLHHVSTPPTTPFFHTAYLYLEAIKSTGMEPYGGVKEDTTFAAGGPRGEGYTDHRRVQQFHRRV